MTLNEYMKKHRSPYCPWQAKRLECNDGFTMSVSASEYSYCSPRATNAKNYTEVEVGFPSEKPESFANYAEGAHEDDHTDYNYTDTVYPYVPVELVELEIKRHGGIKGAVEPYKKMSDREALIKHANETLFKDKTGEPGTFGYFSMKD